MAQIRRGTSLRSVDGSSGSSSPVASTSSPVFNGNAPTDQDLQRRKTMASANPLMAQLFARIDAQQVSGKETDYPEQQGQEAKDEWD